MPGFDRTGPSGQGSMTGRGLGRCAPATPLSPEQTLEQTEAINPAARPVYGLGRGGVPRGCGRGFGGGRRGFR